MLSKLQTCLGYQFRNEALLELALAHRSQGYVNETNHPLNNQRLEFLGDAVLGMVIAEMLYAYFPHAAEGDLSKRLVALVNGATLTEIATEWELGAALDLSDSEAAHGGRANASNLEDACEAIIGAVYLDGGFDAARALISRFWGVRLAQLTTAPKDAKTALQEWAQARSLPLPEYMVESAEGPAHAPEFVIVVHVKGHGSARAHGSNKKAAEREAAALLLAKLPQ